jgi:hypothetical protein
MEKVVIIVDFVAIINKSVAIMVNVVVIIVFFVVIINKALGLWLFGAV